MLPEELASQSVRLKEEQLRREEEKVGVGKLGFTTCSHGDLLRSFVRLSSRCSARSMRRDRNCWRRNNRSGEDDDVGSDFVMLTENRNLESRLAAQGPQELRD